jgi:hypothetical protein
MKCFPLCFELLEVGRVFRLKKTALLFTIFLIAHYHEKARRVRGGFVDSNIGKEWAKYRVRVTDKDIERCLGFCTDTIISIKRSLRSAERYKRRLVDQYAHKNDELSWLIDIKKIRLVSQTREYLKYKHRKYLNIEWQYEVRFRVKECKLYRIPTRIVYDKALTPSQKLAIIWNLCLKGAQNKQLTLKELEKKSGISERTIREAKRFYPELFSKDYAQRAWGD